MYNSTIARVGGGYCLAQLVASVRDNLAAGGGGNQTYLKDEYWSDGEVIRYVNQAYRELWRVGKNLGTDLFVEVMSSTDSTVEIEGISYAPSSLQIVKDVSNYTMPPDLSEIKNIRVITSGQETTRFRHKDRASEEFKVATYRNAATGTGEYLYDVIGRRTLVLAPKPQETVDIEITYVRRLQRLKDYKVGTLNITKGITTIFGVGTEFITAKVRPGSQLITGVVVDVNKEYPVLTSVGGEIFFDLETAYPDASVNGTSYIISDTPELDDVDEIIIAYATQLGFRKGSNPNLKKADSYLGEYARLLPTFKNSYMSRDTDGPEFVETYLEDA